jgi:hypothetical protein
MAPSPTRTSVRPVNVAIVRGVTASSAVRGDDKADQEDEQAKAHDRQPNDAGRERQARCAAGCRAEGGSAR